MDADNLSRLDENIKTMVGQQFVPRATWEVAGSLRGLLQSLAIESNLKDLLGLPKFRNSHNVGSSASV